MEAATAPRDRWTFAQKGIVLLAVVQLLWALAGPSNSSDGIFHLATGALFAIVALVQVRIEPPTSR
jgi:hypothetical protein